MGACFRPIFSAGVREIGHLPVHQQGEGGESAGSFVPEQAPYNGPSRGGPFDAFGVQPDAKTLKTAVMTPNIPSPHCVRRLATAPELGVTVQKR